MQCWKGPFNQKLAKAKSEEKMNEMQSNEIRFPGRVWERVADHATFASRPVTAEDRERRRQLSQSLGAECVSGAQEEPVAA